MDRWTDGPMDRRGTPSMARCAPSVIRSSGHPVIQFSVRRYRPEIVAGHGDAWDRLADHALDRAHHRDLIRRHEGVGIALLRRTARATDSVHIILRLLRHVVVDDVT